MAAGTVLAYLCRHPSCCPLGLSTNSCQSWTQKRVQHPREGIFSASRPMQLVLLSLLIRTVKMLTTLHSTCMVAIVPMVWTQPGPRGILCSLRLSRAQLYDFSWSFDTKMLRPNQLRWEYSYNIFKLIRSGIRHLRALIEVYLWHKYRLLPSACDDSSTHLAFKISSVIGPLNGNSCHFKEEKDTEQK